WFLAAATTGKASLAPSTPVGPRSDSDRRGSLVLQLASGLNHGRLLYKDVLGRPLRPFRRSAVAPAPGVGGPGPKGLPAKPKDRADCRFWAGCSFLRAHSVCLDIETIDLCRVPLRAGDSMVSKGSDSRETRDAVYANLRLSESDVSLAIVQ